MNKSSLWNSVQQWIPLHFVTKSSQSLSRARRTLPIIPPPSNTNTSTIRDLSPNHRPILCRHRTITVTSNGPLERSRANSAVSQAWVPINGLYIQFAEPDDRLFTTDEDNARAIEWCVGVCVEDEQVTAGHIHRSMASSSWPLPYIGRV